jgi:hypothetical protein
LLVNLNIEPYAILEAVAAELDTFIEFENVIDDIVFESELEA